MSKTIKTVIWIIVIILVVWGIYSLATQEGSPEMGEGPVKIGYIGPLTGEAANFGSGTMNAVKLAVEEINESGGIGGNQIEVIYEDGKCTGKEANSAVQKLINIDKVKFIIGGLCSGETLGAAPVAESSNVILFSPGSGSPDITNAGDYIFRNFPSDATSGNKVAEAAIELGYTKTAVLAEANDYAQALKTVFSNTFTEMGGEIVADERFLTEVTDLKTHLTKIKATAPEAIFFVTSKLIKAELFLKQLTELGMNDIQILSNEMLTTKSLLSNHQDVLEGALFAEPFFNQDALETKSFLNSYEDVYGTFVIEGVPPIYLATAYDIAHIIKEAIEEEGYDPSRVKEYLYNIKNRKGAAGTLTIDSNGDPEFEYILKTIKSGEVVSL